MSNVALVAPAGTVTVGGTTTAGLFDDSLTTAPAAGAALLRVAVPVTVVGDPPTKLLGLTLTEDIPPLVTVKVAWATS